LIFDAPDTTWALVTITPLACTMNPEPIPAATCSPERVPKKKS